MLKNTVKRIMSCLLAIVMLITTFFAFGPTGLFPTAQALIAPGHDPLPDVYIVVPETFYLTPSLTASTTVRYYINNTVDGTTITPDETRDATTGKIWFNVASGTVTDLEYTIVGTNKAGVAMSAGSGAETLSDVTLQTGMAAAEVRTLEWIFTCSINGVFAEYHAFSVAYAPYYTPVGAAVNAKNANAGTQMQGISWISGVHGYTDCNPSTAASSDKDNYVLGDYHARTEWDGEWNRPLVPMITSVPVPTNNDENIWDWLSTATAGACSDATFTLYDVDKKAGGTGAKSLDLATRSHIAEMTVDVSRNHSFTTIPNVTTGFFVSDLKRDSKYMGAYGGYIANYDGDVPGIDFWFSQNHYGDGSGSFAATQGVDAAFFGGNPHAGTDVREYNTDGIPYDGFWNRATPTAAGTSMHYIHAAMCGEYNSNWIYINIYLFINVTAVDKTALRNKVFQKQAQANAKALDDYAAVREKLEAAYLALGDPTATQAQIDSAAAGLDDIDVSLGHTATIFAQHINQRTGEPFADSVTEELTVRRSDSDVIVAPNSYTGYSFTGMRKTYGAASAFGLFDADAWAQSACLADGSGITSVTYDASSRSIILDNAETQTNTAYPVSNVLNSNYARIPVDPYGMYTIDFDYASAVRGKIGVICYDQTGSYICNAWLYDSFAASGSTSVFRHHTEVFCPATSSFLFGNTRRFEVRYIVLTFGIYAEESQSAAPAVFCNVSVTPSNELFDLAQWQFYTSSYRSGTNVYGIASKRYDSETKTLTLTGNRSESNTSYTTGNILTSHETVGSQYYPWNFIPVETGATYSVEGAYAGTGNGQILIAHYDASGAFTEATALTSAGADGGILSLTGSDTNFDPFHAAFTAREDDCYIALAFGGARNADASADRTVTHVFRDVKIHASTSADRVYTLYYHPNPYTVSFDAGGGSGMMPDQSFAYDTPQSLIPNAFTRPGYVFDGWATSAGGDRVYADGAVVSNLTAEPDGVVHLYACWAAQSFTILYDEAGGVMTGSYITDYDVNTDITLPTAVKDGFTLTGWRANDVGNWGPITYGAGTTKTGMFGDVTLTAVWRNNTYSVAFNANGGEGTAMANQSFVYGTPQILTANAFSRPGYTFLGWALTNDATEPLYLDKERVKNLTVEPNVVVTLYAVWEANAYTIVYSTDGGTIRDTAYTSAFTVNDRIELPVDVEKTGYSFNGWKPSSNAGSWIAANVYTGTLNSGMIGNVTLQAQWSVQGYMITYALDGGTIKGTRYTTTYNVTDTITLPTAVKTGYTFDGWQANGVGNWDDSVYPAGSVNAGRYGDVTLTAQWTGIQYYVQFNGNGSTGGVMYNQTFTYGVSAALNPNEFVRGGYDFLGWSTAAAATTATYADGEAVQNLSVNAGATVTLYAVWATSSYTIAYDAAGGEITTSGTTAFTITDTILLPTATRAGYTMDGWRPQATVGSWHTWDLFTDSIAAGCYGDVTLAAQWTKDTYRITYDAAGGTMSGSYTTTYDIDTPIVLPAVTRTGYTFGGWSASAAWHYALVVDTAPEGAVGDVTLTAVWVQQAYYVRFHANGGSGSMNDQLMRFDTSQALMLNAFTRDGYSFGGWAMSENGAIAFADGDVVRNLSQTEGAVVDLYATWSARNFSIVYDLNGASGFMYETNVVMDGAAVTLRAYNVTETSINNMPYTFVGWAYSKEDADNGVKAYANKGSFALNDTILSLAEVDWTPARPTITLYAVWRKAEVRLIVPEGQTTEIDNDRGYIYGLKPNITRTELENEFLAVSGNGHIEIVTSGGVGTGTEVRLISDFNNSGEVLATYQIVIFGDINGDGMVNSTDVTRIRMLNANLIEPDFGDVHTFAADLYTDGNINASDITYLRMILASLAEFDQTTRVLTMI